MDVAAEISNGLKPNPNKFHTIYEAIYSRRNLLESFYITDLNSLSVLAQD